MRSKLTGRNVVLSGASGGFGRALTRRLILERNCRVLGIGRSREKMERLQASLGAQGDRFSYRLFDVCEPAAWEALAGELRDENFRPQLLINNAGVLPRFSAWQAGDLPVLEETMAADFYGAVYGTQALLPLLLESGQGMLYNVSSAAAFFPVAGTGPYSAAKGALYNFTLALREELRGRLTVGLICPGFSNTDIFRNQSQETPRGIVAKVCTPPEKIVRGMLRLMDRGGALAVLGADAKLMRLGAAVCPVSAAALTRAILQKSGLPLFDGIFKREERAQETGKKLPPEILYNTDLEKRPEKDKKI